MRMRLRISSRRGNKSEMPKCVSWMEWIAHSGEWRVEMILVCAKLGLGHSIVLCCTILIRTDMDIVLILILYCTDVEMYQYVDGNADGSVGHSVFWRWMVMEVWVSFVLIGTLCTVRYVIVKRYSMVYDIDIVYCGLGCVISIQYCNMQRFFCLIRSLFHCSDANCHFCHF